MIITLNNKEFNFDQVTRRGNTVIFFDNIFGENHILSKRIELNYNFFIEMLNLSLRSYVNCNFKDRNIHDNISELFQFYKLSNNFNVKRDLASKLGYLLINNHSILKDNAIISIFKSYYEEKSIYSKNDKIFKFLVLLFKQTNRDILTSISFEDSDEFDLVDFVLDYNL